MAGIAVESPQEFAFDVLGLGAAAVDDVLFVETFPPPDVKAQVRQRQRNLGGLTAIALATAARLGCKTAYAGTLGSDEFSEFVMSSLREEGVDVSYVPRHPDARPVIATIVVGSTRSTRNIFFQLNDISGAHPELPDADVIRSARVLFVDHIGVEGMLRAARIAHDADIPIVADFELAVSPRFPELLALVDHLIVSREMAARLTGETDPAAAARKLWTGDRRVAAVTCGADGAWYVTDSDPASAQHQPAFVVNTVDTTGCGDVFHGAYAACLARGMEAAERIRVAAAAAALKATRTGGRTAIPTQSELEQFLKETT